MAYAKPAHLLAHAGPIEAERKLYELLSTLGEIQEVANVSRIDLYVDFETDCDLEGWTGMPVTRAGDITAHAQQG